MVIQWIIWGYFAHVVICRIMLAYHGRWDEAWESHQIWNLTILQLFGVRLEKVRIINLGRIKVYRWALVWGFWPYTGWGKESDGVSIKRVWLVWISKRIEVMRD